MKWRGSDLKGFANWARMQEMLNKKNMFADMLRGEEYIKNSFSGGINFEEPNPKDYIMDVLCGTEDLDEKTGNINAVWGVVAYLCGKIETGRHWVNETK